ncbi:MAG TPA: ATP synthase F0 subunit A [Firmicutes bacterium]|nr:ATP synthase F0 subunit A [Bacillota bacterium]
MTRPRKEMTAMHAVGEHDVRLLLALKVNFDTLTMSWITIGVLAVICLIAFMFRYQKIRDFSHKANMLLGGKKTRYFTGAVFGIILVVNFLGFMTDSTAFWCIAGWILLLLILHGHELQGILEALYRFLKDTVAENMPAAAHSSFNFIATMFIFILCANMIGLLPIAGFKSPTADVNVTLGLALLVLAATIYYGCKVRGVKAYLLSFFQPNVVFFPVHLIDMLVKPFSLAFRLFGNIFAGEVLLMILYFLIPVAVPALWIVISMFIGVIQAYLFAMLSIAYISSATNH